MKMNMRQAIVFWITALICVFAFIVSFPTNFNYDGDDYAFNLMSMYIVNLMKVLPVILLIGGFLFFLLKGKDRSDKKKLPKVLVVDDDSGVLTVMEQMLQRMGYHALTLPTGELVSERLKNERVEFVLLDIRLPGRSGMEILREIKKDHPEMPVIMLTGLGHDDSAVKEALGMGASGYVAKTSGLSALKDVISNVLLSKK